MCLSENLRGYVLYYDHVTFYAFVYDKITRSIEYEAEQQKKTLKQRVRENPPREPLITSQFVSLLPLVHRLILTPQLNHTLRSSSSQ
jgi:hypothetical protein